MLIRIFLLCMLFSGLLSAATVVTTSERIAGTIIEQTDEQVTLKTSDGKLRKIDRRKEIQQVFDDQGQLVWQSPAIAKPVSQNTTSSYAKIPPFAKKAIIADIGIGTAGGGFYDEEKRLLDALGIYAKYSDGTIQNAETSLMTITLGLHYQWYDTPRWSSLLSYVYRTASQRSTTGDGNKYKSETIVNEQLTALHSLLYGKEVHFYLGSGTSSFDLVGQVGYEAGQYFPLAGYNSARRLPSANGVPLPVFSTPASLFIHGPTGRAGLGFTLRSDERLQFGLRGYYQIAYTFTSEQIWVAVPKNTVVQDIYAVLYLGVGF